MLCISIIKIQILLFINSVGLMINIVVSCHMEAIDLLIKASEYIKKKPKKRAYSFLLIPVDERLNNYEVTEWEKYYLSLWNLNPIQPYIRTHALVLNLDVWDLPFVQKYFSYEDSNDIITVSRFVEFTKIIGFFKMLGISNGGFESVQKWIKTIKNEQSEFILMESFTEYLKNNQHLRYVLQYLRTKLIEKIVTNESYKNIMRRKQFYTNYIIPVTPVSPTTPATISSISTTMNTSFPSIPSIRYNNTILIVKPPQEQCFSKIYRVCFTNLPPPYYVDYVQNQTPENIIINLRKRFGYSSRPFSKFRFTKNKSSTIEPDDNLFNTNRIKSTV